MSVPSQTPQAEYVANGVQTVFTVPFDIVEAGDLAVYVDGTLKNLTTDYTVDLDAGSMTFQSAPSNGGVIVLERAMAYARTVDFQILGSFFSDTANDDSDRHTMAEQQLQVRIDRAIRFAPGYEQGRDLELSLTPSERADKVLAFDDDGDITVSEHTLTEIEDAIDITAASEAAAAASAVSAASSASSASTSATNADTSFVSFANRYLGAKSSAPTVDNYGGALITGTLYYDTVLLKVRVWNGSSWEDATTGISQGAGDIRYGRLGSTNAWTSTNNFYGDVTVPTKSAGDNSFNAASTAYVDTSAATLLSGLRGCLFGLTLSTAGSSATFSIAAGSTINSTNTTMMVLSAFTKTASSWAVGTGNGALDAGTIANSTWYHVFLIKRVDTGVVDVLVSLSATSPTMPANYTVFRRIGSMQTDGSAKWVKFSQVGNKFYRLMEVGYTIAGTASATLRTLAGIPTGIVVEPMTSIVSQAVNNNTGQIQFAPASDATLLFTAQQTYEGSGVSGSTSTTFVIGPATNTSAQIYIAVPTTSGASMVINTVGWVDDRGQTA